MPQAQTQDTVQIHYTGTLDDGTVFDSSRESDPLQFTLGQQQVIPGFEDAVMGMEIGEAKTVRIPADQAYGEHRPDLVLTVRRDQLPPELEPELGQRLQVQDQRGQPFVVTVHEITEAEVKLDANHPLAGQALTFELELVAIND